MTFSQNTKQRKTFFYKGLAITDEMELSRNVQSKKTQNLK